MRGLYWRTLCTLLTLTLIGCAPRHTPLPASGPEDRLALALTAWQVGDYELAALELSRLATDPPTPEFGARARLYLLALELDPRNSMRDISNGAAIAVELITDPTVSRTARPLGEVFFLLARDLGAEVPGDSSRLQELPQLPRPPLSTRLDSLLQEHDQQLQESARLQQSLKRKDEEIEKLKNELERIRSIIRK